MPNESSVIILWYGAIVDIPTGWYLCDGTHDTPDLRNLIPIGAGDTYNPDDSGGDVEHRHNYWGSTHTHLVTPGTDIEFAVDKRPTPVSIPGWTDMEDTSPPVKALCYVKFLPCYSEG